MRLGLALRAFWKALFDRAAAERVAIALDAPIDSRIEQKTSSPQREPSPTAAPQPPAAPAQNPAITLLATLQRDARLIDLIYENLDQYQDAQVGAAARPCLKQCRQSLDRILKIEKLVPANESESVEVPPNASVARFRWIGESSASAAATAKLVHPGWQAAAIQLPQWSGQAADAEIIAPAQVSAS
ncbi:DUF2760 domain-containing protein [Allorhodopirellula heiligendammensis]|uniref:DUF2760 domain-containing protein n=1 Tax=Allorhodopirellula heiligendammensis TaxID=2714739 RepID=A0A5C6C8P7_9BACT|nr:DUF2760 domain-containing protein [Allorhodopirellula heiligendammensis]TWU19129.1 hypothetical protein Poly21_13000 [Allorhodopirellula heiligendammensis]|tara:strand:- start:346 stop:903 length:558 start_codon:yes stop_codon:yes gene_type:complete